MIRFASSLAAAMLFAASLNAAAPSRDELLRSPKYADAKAPRFEVFTPESLRGAVRVVPRRSYATFGFNDPAVTVRLPAATNSVDSVVSFDSPKLTDAGGRAVAFELEQGIFDFDTSTTEIRMTKAKDFAHAAGKLTVKYPIAITTLTLKKGESGKDLTIDGPYVTWNSSSLAVPQAATFSKILPVRAYDASGRQLERVESSSSVTKNDATWTTYSFWGPIASVQIDRVDKWAEVAVDYDLPPAPKLASSQQGNEPTLEERIKRMETPGGKVTKTLVVEQAPAAEPAGNDDAPLTPDAARAELKDRRIDPTGPMLAMYGVKGDEEVVKLLLAAGVPIDSRDNNGSMTALIGACSYKHKKVALLLIKSGADVNVRDAIGGTALLHAAEKCSWTSVVNALLKRGAKTSFKTNGGSDALQRAEMYHCDENAKAIKGK